MDFPDLLYVPQAYEVAKDTLQPRRLTFFQVNVTAATALSAQTRTVPKDEVWVITRYLIRCTPGAAQTCTFRRADLIQQPTGILIATIDEDRTVSAAGTIIVRESNLPLWMMPDESFQVYAGFSAAGVANRIDTYAIGWTLPRASVQHATG